nr:retrovirus-related Pol polyprotein from transposon TNT 1-94 [Tanacetum cinerariifolium]
MNDDTPMCERHEINYIQSGGHQNRNSHDSYSHQSHHDPNDPEKSLIELNNDVKNDLEDFKRRIRSMKTVHWKLFAKDDEYQLADMFTKALLEDRFKYLVRQIGMRCLTPAELEVLAKESA